MANFETQLIRLELDLADRDGPVDLRTQATPALWRGSALRFDIGLFLDAALLEVGQLATLTLEVKPLSSAGGAPAPDTAPEMSRTTATFDTSVDADSWAARSKAHASVAFTADECNLAAGRKWLVISATTTAPAQATVTLAAGPIVVLEDGYASAGTAPVLDNSAYTKAEADARYLLASQDLGDLSNAATARANLGIPEAVAAPVGARGIELTGTGELLSRSFGSLGTSDFTLIFWLEGQPEAPGTNQRFLRLGPDAPTQRLIDLARIANSDTVRVNLFGESVSDGRQMRAPNAWPRLLGGPKLNVLRRAAGAISWEIEGEEIGLAFHNTFGSAPPADFGEAITGTALELIATGAGRERFFERVLLFNEPLTVNDVAARRSSGLWIRPEERVGGVTNHVDGSPTFAAGQRVRIRFGAGEATDGTAYFIINGLYYGYPDGLADGQNPFEALDARQGVTVTLVDAAVTTVNLSSANGSGLWEVGAILDVDLTVGGPVKPSRTSERRHAVATTAGVTDLTEADGLRIETDLDLVADGWLLADQTTYELLPAGYLIEQVVLCETAGQAVTGLELGTGAAAADLLAATNLAANACQVLAPAQPLPNPRKVHVHVNASGGAWNGGHVRVVMNLIRQP